MSFTPVFSGGSIAPANQSFLDLDLTADATLEWAIEQQNGSGYPIASQIDITTTTGLSISLPAANQGSNGFSILFVNKGANTFSVKNNGGGTIVSIASGEAWFVYLEDNSTVNGVWGTFQFGAGVSTSNAASLAGAGLAASGSLLNQQIPVASKAANYVVLTSDLAKVLMWTGGLGDYTLPSAATAGAGWFVMVRNSGVGSLNVTPPSGTIDGGSTLLVTVGESAIIFCDGANYYTVGFGQNQNSAFDYITFSVAGTGDYILAGVQLNRVSYDLTGILTGNRNIIVPTTVQQYWVQNNTTGAFTLTVKTAAGTGVAIPQGSSAIVFCDGTNVINAAVSSSVTFPITIGQGGTGQTTAGAALTALGAAASARVITAGAGLTGGGDLTADRSLALSFLGLQTLVDPNVDRILFFDDSAGNFEWLAPSTGLAISGTALALSFLGLQTLTDPNADRILFWDDSAGSFAWLTLGTNLSITGTTIDAAGGSSTFCGCLVRNSVSQVLGTTFPIAVTFDTESYDTDSIHDPGTPDRFTVPVGKTKMKVNFTVQFPVGASGDSWVIQLYKNGSTSTNFEQVYATYGPFNTTGGVAQGVTYSTGWIPCTAGSYIEIRTSTNNAGSPSISQAKAAIEFM